MRRDRAIVRSILLFVFLTTSAPAAGPSIDEHSHNLTFTLCWAKSTTLDLFVFDPQGDYLSYETLETPSLGDLCLHALHASAGHVSSIRYWPPWRTPPGTYSMQVMLDNGEPSQQPIPFHIIVSVDGEPVHQITDQLSASNPGPAYDFTHRLPAS